MISCLSKNTFTGAVLVCIAILVVLTNAMPKIEYAIISIVLLILYFYVIYKYEPNVFMLLLLLMFGQLSAIVSNAYIESGGFILEQIRYGYTTGSTVRLVAYNIVFIVASVSVYNALSNIKAFNYRYICNKVPMAYLYFIYIIITIMFMLLLGGLIVYGSPLIMKIDRFEYWNNHPMPILESIRYKMNIVALLLGMIHANNTIGITNKRCNITMLILIFFINILYGDKFSGAILTLCLFITPLAFNAIVKYGKLHISYRMVAYGVAFVVIIVTLISYHYRDIARSSQVKELIIARALGLQGHVWWGIDEIYFRKGSAEYPNPCPKDRWRVLLGEKLGESETGMNALMYEVSPAKLVNDYIERKVRFTMGNPAIALYTLGYGWLIIYQILTSILYTLFMMYFRKQIMSFNIFRASICTLIFLGMVEAVVMGNIYFIYSTYIIKYVVLIIYIEFAETTLTLPRSKRNIATT